MSYYKKCLDQQLPMDTIIKKVYSISVIGLIFHNPCPIALIQNKEQTSESITILLLFGKTFDPLGGSQDI